MNRITKALIGFLIIFTACTKSEKETPGGMKYTVVKDADGNAPKPEEYIAFNYVMKDSKDSVWNSSYENGLPGVMMFDSALLKEDNILQMFSTLSAGDSVKVTMPLTKFFKDIFRQPLPPNVDSTRSLTLTAKIEDIVSKDSIRSYYGRLQEVKNKGQKAKDAKLIAGYLADKKINAQSDTSGLYYVVHASKGGQKPTAENCVKVTYEGKLMKTGQVFDKNAEGVSFPLGGVIPGWQLGIPKLGVGDSATLYIPSHLAYGSQGIPGAIPPDAILVFDVKLLSVGATYDQASNSCK